MPVAFGHIFVSALLMLDAGRSAVASPLYVDGSDGPYDAYAPISGSCPKGPMLRAATGLRSAEEAYMSKRKPICDKALKHWLTKLDPVFVTENTTLPNIALTISGGGLRSFLTGAGVVSAMDDRESYKGDAALRGLFQSLFYLTGLSGGVWLVTSIANHDWPSITNLKETWRKPLEKGIWKPHGLHHILGNGFEGGIQSTFSDIALSSNFNHHQVPYPIVTARYTDLDTGQCLPVGNSTQFEFGPYEFGSWDQGVDAFIDTKYLGTNLTNGKPYNRTCVTRYDNIGYIAGTSSNLINAMCDHKPNTTTNATFWNEMMHSIGESIFHGKPDAKMYGSFPNPFYKYAKDPKVNNDVDLALADGGEAGQYNPIWPVIQPARNVDVIIVNDNSGNLDYPDGKGLHTTYGQAKHQGLHKMPFIPTDYSFVKKELNKHATFFGCGNPDVSTIVWLPNFGYDYKSNTKTFKLKYDKKEMDGMIANGANVATQHHNKQWPTCLACAIMEKHNDALPDACEKCFESYCYKP